MQNIPHNKPSSVPGEDRYIQQVLKSHTLVDGYYLQTFENKVCEYLDLPQGQAVAVSSGSAALYVSLMILGAPNKVVSMPSYVCSSLRQATTLAGARCNVLDISEGFPQIDPSLLEQCESDILINPYLYGLASHLPRFDGPVIEDCAQAFGAKMDGAFLGTIGDVGVLSFYATKLLTSGGQGGMIVSKNKSFIDEARDFIHFDQRRDDRLRFNFSMTELQAAVGLAQLECYDQFLQKRNEIWDLYQSYGLPLLDNKDPKACSVRFRAVLQTSKPQRVVNHLARKNIAAIIPIEDWELLNSDTVNAVALARKTVSLPIYPDLRHAEKIAKCVSEIL